MPKLSFHCSLLEGYGVDETSGVRHTDGGDGTGEQGLTRNPMISMPFDQTFELLSGGHARHKWQHDLASRTRCENHLIRVPTGMGKTLGVLGVWIHHRVVRSDLEWPRRLVWCLPMRVLVEQTAGEVRQALLRVHQSFPKLGPVGVHELMGGADSGDWHLYPERDAVLIGTQDMLLSRALNRGYGCPRARWPMDFGLLSHDCLRVLDEVQLMDVGLATSGQLQVFRDEDAQKEQKGRPCRSWWMSATLQDSWLRKSPDTEVLAGKLETTRAKNW